MTHRTTARRRLIAVVVTALALISGGLSPTAHAHDSVTPTSQPAPTNPDQAYGPGIVTIEQTNMCMWGSKETPFCFANTHQPGEAGWEAAELATAERKRDSLISQYNRHRPDVITVTEGCLGDLRTVADAIGYQLRYQETGGGTDDKARECTVDRGVGVNAILARTFTGTGPQGYFQEHGYRSYLCAQVGTTEQWQSFRVCTTHLSLPSQDGRQPIECEIMRDVLADSPGDVLFAGDLNMKGPGEHCAPADLNGLKNLERDPANNTGVSGLQHIYYSSTGMWRQSCGWSYTVENTDHKGFLLELGRSSDPDTPAGCFGREID